MNGLGKRRISLFVDRITGRWVVRDPEGNLWTVPLTESPWEHRQPYVGSEESNLELVPTHYAYVLKLPF